MANDPRLFEKVSIEETGSEEPVENPRDYLFHFCCRAPSAELILEMLNEGDDDLPF